MTRLVVDTNVFVSALIFGGKPAMALQAVEALGIQITVSDELESELADTLTDKFEWAPERVSEVLARLLQNAYRVTPVPINGIVRDRDDDHVLAAAITSSATVIVTGD